VKVEFVVIVDVQDSAASVFRQGWCEVDECWSNELLASQFTAPLVVRDAFNTLISSDRPGDHDVIVTCSSPLWEVFQV